MRDRIVTSIDSNRRSISLSLAIPTGKEATTPQQEIWHQKRKKLRNLIKRVKVIVIPDIESVNYGRGVGYDIIEHIPPKKISEISATKIREKLFTK